MVSHIIRNGNGRSGEGEAFRTPVLVRSRNGDLLEIPASEASDRLRADLDLLSVLMHAQHEGALSYGDIRFGPIRNKTIEPGSIG